MGRFPVDSGGSFSVFLVVNHGVKKGDFPSFLRSVVNVIQGSNACKCSKKVCVFSDFAVAHTSSINLFQDKGGSVSVVSALFSRSSITMFAIITETG